MSLYQIKENEIAIIDPIGSTGSKCKCSNDAMFILLIHGHAIQICEQCLGKVGKTIIDGLI
jgi:hypothetical protein